MLKTISLSYMWVVNCNAAVGATTTAPAVRKDHELPSIAKVQRGFNEFTRNNFSAKGTATVIAVKRYNGGFDREEAQYTVRLEGFSDKYGFVDKNSRDQGAFTGEARGALVYRNEDHCWYIHDLYVGINARTSPGRECLP